MWSWRTTAAKSSRATNLLFYTWYQDKSADLFEIPVPDQLEQELVIELD